MLPGGSTWLSWGPTSRSGRRCWTPCMSVCLLATGASRQLPGGPERCLSWLLHKQCSALCCKHPARVPVSGNGGKQAPDSVSGAIRCLQDVMQSRLHCFYSLQHCHLPWLRLNCRRGPWASTQLSGRRSNCLTPVPVTAHAVCTRQCCGHIGALQSPAEQARAARACPYPALSCLHGFKAWKGIVIDAVGLSICPCYCAGLKLYC